MRQERTGKSSRGPRFRLAVAVAGLSVLAAVPALAQGWPWNWGGGWGKEQPQPREPVYRQPPPGQPVPPQSVPPSYPQSYSQGSAGRAPICLQLEQRLAQEANRGSQSRDILPRLESDIRLVDRQVRSGQEQLDRAGCFEYFLFSKSLKRSRQCV